MVAVSDVLLKDSASTSAAKHRYRNRCYKLWLRGVGSGGNPTLNYDSCHGRPWDPTYPPTPLYQLPDTMVCITGSLRDVL